MTGNRFFSPHQKSGWPYQTNLVGEASNELYNSDSSRSILMPWGKVVCIQVVLPVARGPKRKKLLPGGVFNILAYISPIYMVF